MKVIEDYARAVETSDEDLLKEVFAPHVRVEVPAGTTLNSAGSASHVMSQVARVAPGVKRIRTAEAGSDWYFLGFEGEFEGQKLQVIDQIHVNKDGRIDQLIIYMRPIPAAEKFGEAVVQRFQPATARS